MKLIVGLGNVGADYDKTRHNLGFLVIDQLSHDLGADGLKPNLKFAAEVVVHGEGDDRIILAKPTTMMNLSGEAVQKIQAFYKVDPQDIWVVSDDFNLEFGVVRVRIGGSDGGHNGLKSIITAVGPDFARIRIGIQNPELEHMPAEKFVLAAFAKAESEKLSELVHKASQLIREALQTGIDHVTQ